ncbi:MAG: tRNA (adenosine(37)-N6)-dimethylallyltransferase MiaA [Shimia sp.]
MAVSGFDIRSLDRERPILIAGPTASGKSALAMEIAAAHGGVIVNADAMQVFDGWRVLTARPSEEDENALPHRLFGHIPVDAPYSVGDWLRSIEPLLHGKARPIIVGGTGLYFRALTEGLADIPPVPPAIREEADSVLATRGLDALAMALDAETRAKIDLANPMRVQRAWEVLRATGRGLARWQSETPPPLLALGNSQPLLLMADKAWLNHRIGLRFDRMLTSGALEEARMIAPRFDAGWASSKAIGAPQLVAYVKGELRLSQAMSQSIIASQQYAKRQRTWFRARMAAWQTISLP